MLMATLADRSVRGGGRRCPRLGGSWGADERAERAVDDLLIAANLAAWHERAGGRWSGRLEHATTASSALGTGA